MQRLSPLNEGLFTLVKNVVQNALPLGCTTGFEDDFFKTAKEALFDNAYYSWDISYICEFVELLPQMSAPDDEERISELLDYIIDNNLNHDDAALLNDELSSLEQIEKKYGLGVSGQIESLRNSMALT
jgi:hypothetical protein